jgi:hypothetical protein
VEQDDFMLIITLFERILPKRDYLHIIARLLRSPKKTVLFKHFYLCNHLLRHHGLPGQFSITMNG